MDKFIALSESSKKALQVALMSANLPVNIIVLGQAGVGRKLLAKEILPQAQAFEAKELEKLIIENKINLEQFTSLIIHNLNKVVNKEQFLENLQGIKLVATSFDGDYSYIDNFAVKINIPPLDERIEDLEELKKIYINEARKIYTTSITSQDIKVDLSGNGITLKQSIFKTILLDSLTKQDIIDTLYNFFIKELHQGRGYKDLLAIFEVPLLKAAKTVYKSQLKMSEKLKINRITLRKKLSKYFGE